RALIGSCLKPTRERLMERFAPYKALADLAQGFLEKEGAAYASRQFMLDLAVWFHLAWLCETVRRGDPRALELIAKERDFDAADCRQLIEIIADIMSGLLPRYRRLLGSGQVELSVTPFGHPILALMLDFRSARDSQPGLELPAEREYPGGDDRARWHIARAIQTF